MPSDRKKLLADLAVALKDVTDAASDDEARKAARDEFLDDVRDALPDAYQAIAGASAKGAREDEKRATKRVSTERDAARAEAAELKAKLDELEANKPDVAALTRAAETRAKKAEDALEAERAARQDETRTRALRDATKSVEQALTDNEDGRFRTRAARREVLQLQADGIIKLNDEGEVEYYNLKHPTERYAAGRNGEPAYAQLVRDVIATADPLDLESGVDRGAGLGAAGSGTRGVPARRPSGAAARPGQIDVEDPAIQHKVAKQGIYGAI